LCIKARVCWLLLTLSAVLLSGCATSVNFRDYHYLDHRRAQLALSEEQNRERVAAIASEVARAYAGAECLSFSAEPVWHGVVRARIETAMGRGKFKTRLYVNGELAHVMTFRDGVIEEAKRECRGVPAAYELRPADHAFGSPNVNQLEGIDEYGCMMGGFCATWLGPNAPKAQFFAERIRRGKYLGATRLRGQECRLVLCQPTERYWGIELFYVRPDGFVIQWDTFYPDEDGGTPQFMRTRPYVNLSTTPLPEDRWDFEHLVRVRAWSQTPGED